MCPPVPQMPPAAWRRLRESPRPHADEQRSARCRAGQEDPVLSSGQTPGRTQEPQQARQERRLASSCCRPADVQAHTPPQRKAAIWQLHFEIPQSHANWHNYRMPNAHQMQCAIYNLYVQQDFFALQPAGAFAFCFCRCCAPHLFEQTHCRCERGGTLWFRFERRLGSPWR